MDNKLFVPEERRRQIAQLIRETGSVTVAALEREFRISAPTVRRDLSVLEQTGQAERTHGGAVLPAVAAQEDSFEHRLQEAIPAKKRLAEVALALVEQHETTLIDSSTTAYYALQRLLANDPQATFLTNLLPAMDLFKTIKTANTELIGIGGTYKELTKSFVGPSAVQMVKSYFADKTFLSVKGVTPAGYLTDPDPLEAEVKRTMVECSKNPVLLVDGRKFERKGMSVITHVSNVSLILAADASKAHLQALATMGVRVEIA